MAGQFGFSLLLLCLWTSVDCCCSNGFALFAKDQREIEATWRLQGCGLKMFPRFGVCRILFSCDTGSSLSHTVTSLGLYICVTGTPHYLVKFMSTEEIRHKRPQKMAVSIIKV